MINPLKKFNKKNTAIYGDEKDDVTSSNLSARLNIENLFDRRKMSAETQMLEERRNCDVNAMLALSSKTEWMETVL